MVNPENLDLNGWDTSENDRVKTNKSSNLNLISSLCEDSVSNFLRNVQVCTNDLSGRIMSLVLCIFPIFYLFYLKNISVLLKIVQENGIL